MINIVNTIFAGIRLLDWADEQTFSFMRTHAFNNEYAQLVIISARNAKQVSLTIHQDYSKYKEKEIKVWCKRRGIDMTTMPPRLLKDKQSWLLEQIQNPSLLFRGYTNIDILNFLSNHHQNEYKTMILWEDSSKIEDQFSKFVDHQHVSPPDVCKISQKALNPSLLSKVVLLYVGLVSRVMTFVSEIIPHNNLICK